MSPSPIWDDEPADTRTEARRRDKVLSVIDSLTLQERLRVAQILLEEVRATGEVTGEYARSLRLAITHTQDARGARPRRRQAKTETDTGPDPAQWQ